MRGNTITRHRPELQTPYPFDATTKAAGSKIVDPPSIVDKVNRRAAATKNRKISEAASS